VDVDRFWLTYLGAAMLPEVVVTPCFMLLSLAHFSADVGLALSLALHWAALLATAGFGRQRGAQIIFFYLALFHTPLHYTRAVQRGRVLGLVCSFMVSVAVFAALRGKQTVCVGEWRQKMIIAHILNEALSTY
jgi:hypothetical protein